MSSSELTALCFYHQFLSLVSPEVGDLNLAFGAFTHSNGRKAVCSRVQYKCSHVGQDFVCDASDFILIFSHLSLRMLNRILMVQQREKRNMR